MAYKRYDEDDLIESDLVDFQSSSGSIIDEDNPVNDYSFISDSDSDIPSIQASELEAEKFPVEKTDQSKISSVRKPDEDEEYSVVEPDKGETFSVWNTFTLQRCDERVLPEIKRGNILHSHLCKRCFRPRFLIPPRYKKWRYPSHSWRSFNLPCDSGVSNGI